MSKCICQRSCGESRTDPDCPECGPRLARLHSEPAQRKHDGGYYDSRTDQEKALMDNVPLAAKNIGLLDPIKMIGDLFAMVKLNGGSIKITSHTVGEISETTMDVKVDPTGGFAPVPYNNLGLPFAGVSGVVVNRPPHLGLHNQVCWGCNEDDRGFVVVKGCPKHDNDEYRAFRAQNDKDRELARKMLDMLPLKRSPSDDGVSGE